MKELVKDLLFGRDSKFNNLIFLALVVTVAVGCSDNDNSNGSTGKENTNSPDAISSSEMPSESKIRAMYRETTADFANAIESEDFATFYDKTSIEFQLTKTLEETKDAFKSYTDRKRVIAPIIERASTVEPEFSPAPSIRTEAGKSVLIVNGKSNVKPAPYQFEYEYVNRDGEWKLLSIYTVIK